MYFGRSQQNARPCVHMSERLFRRAGTRRESKFNRFSVVIVYNPTVGTQGLHDNPRGRVKVNSQGSIERATQDIDAFPRDFEQPQRPRSEEHFVDGIEIGLREGVAIQYVDGGLLPPILCKKRNRVVLHLCVQ